MFRIFKKKKTPAQVNMVTLTKKGMKIPVGENLYQYNWQKDEVEALTFTKKGTLVYDTALGPIISARTKIQALNRGRIKHKQIVDNLEKAKK